jgi:hypothetical protein
MAMEAYQMEGDEMYRQFGMLSELDDKEYNRNVTAYDATYQHRNQIYNESYSRFRDSKSDAFAMANLQLNEHGQRVSDAYNYYNAVSNEADKVYEREYNSWMDSVNIAWKEGSMLNSDYWNETKLDYQKDRDAVADSQWEKNFAETVRVNNAQIAKMKSSGSGSGSGTKKIGATSPTSQQVKGAKNAFETQGIEGYIDYLEALPETVNINELDAIVGSESNLGMYYNTYTKTKDTFNGGFNWFGEWNVDNNDVVEDQNGKTYKLKDLPEDVQMILTKAAEGDSYEWDSEERKWVKK